MSSYKHWWIPNVARALKAFPSLIAKKDEIRKTAITAKYSADPRGDGASRSTEDIALTDLPPAEARIVDAIESALDEVSRRRDGDEMTRLVDLVHFRRSHTLYGAATALNMSVETAKRKNGDFIRIVAKKFGYLEK